MRYIILLLIIVPALEISLLILSGNTIGVWPTIVLIITTGVLGAWLAKSQGLKAITAAQAQMSIGQIPGESIVDGLCILVGGVLLLTPGFVTDAVGFIFLFPSSRKFVKRWVKKWLEYAIRNGKFIILRR